MSLTSPKRVEELPDFGKAVALMMTGVTTRVVSAVGKQFKVGRSNEMAIQFWKDLCVPAIGLIKVDWF